MSYCPLMAGTAIITGGSRGIGAATARQAAMAGYDVCINYVTHSKAADRVVAECEALGRKALAVKADVGNAQDVAELFTACDNALGPVSLLVNNAGIGGEGKKIEEIDLVVFEEMYRVHVAGTFFATQALLPQMKARNKGKIINTTSIFAQVGHYESSHYVAAKSAISGLTKAWAREFAPWNITVNSVAPGFIETDMTRLSTTPEQIDALANSLPFGRLCAPIDISYAVAWLASFETNLITGQVISPNAGQVIC